jgi:hypothetical protein
LHSDRLEELRNLREAGLFVETRHNQWLLCFEDPSTGRFLYRQLKPRGDTFGFARPEGMGSHHIPFGIVQNEPYVFELHNRRKPLGKLSKQRREVAV